MKKVGWIGAISGATAGGVGALLVSAYDFSLLFVMIIGAIIGLGVDYLAQKI